MHESHNYGSERHGGEGVLLECLKDPSITQVLVINRRPCGHQHPKLREIIHGDFLNLAPVEKDLQSYDACFFCLGVSSVGMKPDDYKKMTYDLTLEMAKRLAKFNPDLTFCYVTGAHTDTSEKGPVRWARVKGATENELLRIFKNGYMFRPGAMTASPGQKNLKPLYKWVLPIFPIFKPFFPSAFLSLEQVGRAMIHCAQRNPKKHILEIADIREVAK